jgi:hypothetical protein
MNINAPIAEKSSRKLSVSQKPIRLKPAQPARARTPGRNCPFLRRPGTHQDPVLLQVAVVTPAGALLEQDNIQTGRAPIFF